MDSYKFQKEGERNLKQNILLMLQDTPVLEFNFDEGLYQIHESKLLPVYLRDAIIVPVSTDATEQRKAAQSNYNRLITFLGKRVLTLSRTNAKLLYDAYNLPQGQDLINKVKICIICHGLSASDDYWIKAKNEPIEWNEVCVRKNHLSESIVSVVLGGKFITLEGRPHTPEFTGQGSYAKAWRRYEDEVYLCKRSTPTGMESQIEVEVSNILDCFSVNHVKYFADTYDGNYICRCKDIANDDLSIVSAEDLMAYCITKDIDFNAIIPQIDPNNFYATCVVDYLIANSDRHIENWGFYMNNHTGEIVGMHPMFDHNNAFQADPEHDLSKMIPQKTMESAAKFALKKCDFRCVKPVTRDLFLTEEHYDGFMKRAVNLGLYQKKEKKFFEKVFHNKRENFEPVKISLQENTLVKTNIDPLLINHLRELLGNKLPNFLL